jgi:hypothetical protein
MEEIAMVKARGNEKQAKDTPIEYGGWQRESRL